MARNKKTKLTPKRDSILELNNVNLTDPLYFSIKKETLVKLESLSGNLKLTKKL
ncbi:hypothetical protein PSKAS_29050 [Peribacillus sp. N1]